jgi:hypothetical protein
VEVDGAGRGATGAARAVEGQSRQIQRGSKCMDRMWVMERRRWQQPLSSDPWSLPGGRNAKRILENLRHTQPYSL